MKKKILIIGSKDTSLLIFRKELMVQLLNHSFEVIAAGPDSNTDVIKKLENLNINYSSYFLNRTGQNPLADIKSLFSLYNLIQKVNPNYILTYTIKPNVFTSLALKIFGIKSKIKHISLVEGLGYFGMRQDVTLKQKIIQSFLQILYRWHSRIADGIIFLNPDDINFFRKKKICTDNKKMHLINGIGVNLETFKYSTPKTTPVTFLLVARMIQAKGIMIYLNAAKKIKEKFGNNAILELVGPMGEQKNVELEQEIANCNSSNTVNYRGATMDIIPHYEHCSVFVLPSYYQEGLPRTLMEAMAIGRPVITTNNTGCRETVINEINGFIIPVKSVEKLVEKMSFFINHPEKIIPMGVKSRKLCEERFDSKKINEKIIQIISTNNDSCRNQ